MTTHHRPRLHPHLVARTTGQSIAVATAGGVLAAVGCPVWVVLLLAAAGVLELVHDAHRRQERRWAANNQPLPDSDLTRPLAEVLPPLTRAALAASAAPEEPTMPTTYPEIALPPEYAATLDTHAIDAVPDPPPTRWLRLRDMHRGDEFTFADKTLTLVGLEAPDHLSAVGLVSVAVRGLSVGGDGVALLTLPAGQRWQMVQALRHASVRCLVCGGHDGLGEQTYDLAKPDTRDVEAICRTCQQVTTGGAS